MSDGVASGMMLHGLHAEFVEKSFVFVDGRIRRGEECFASKNGIRAGEKAEGDGFAREFVAAAGEAHAGSGHENARGGDGANHNHGIEFRNVGERSAFNPREDVNRHAFRMRIEIRELLQKAEAIFVGFAEAENSSAADGDTGFADARDGGEAIFINTRGDNVTVKVGRSVEIVIVSGEAGIFEARGLRIGEHAERAADFEIESGDAADHFEYGVEFFSFRNVAPGRAHAKARGAVGFGALGGCEHVGGIH